MAVVHLPKSFILPQIMDKPLLPTRNLPRIIAYLILGSLLFAVAYSQSPLFTSNQNQYFLHGLANGGYGNLKQDWLANTLDPTPVFSALVETTYRFIHFEPMFYLYYAALMGIYLVSLFGIADTLFDLRSSNTKSLLFLAIFFAIHSAGFRFAVSRLLGTNWTYILEDGVADQRMLGPVLQPSTIGVLLVLSIYLFLKSRPYLAVIAAVLAASVHPTYLLAAAVLTCVYMITLFIQNRKVKQPFILGVFALIVVAPIAVYVLTSFGSASVDVSERARQILVEYRIPQHAIVSQWLDATAIVKLILVTMAVYLARGTRLFVILFLSSIVAILLTLLQVLTKNYALALIFPWRLSIFIIPLSVLIILGCLVSHVGHIHRFQSPAWEKGIIASSVLIIFCTVLVGGVRFQLELDRKAKEPERAMEAYIYTHSLLDAVYLTPTDMQDFRLDSGAPVYVDFKSIPYKDTDVLEWYRRVRLDDRFYKNLDCKILIRMVTEDHVTNAIIARDKPALQCPNSDVIYHDNYFTIYRLTSP